MNSTRCQTVGLSIPEDVLDRIDKDRCDVSRSRYLLRLIEQAYAQKEHETTTTTDGPTTRRAPGSETT
jgi:hypothetical protein